MIYSSDSLKLLPQSSGVYLFRDLLGQIIYIGKAINLKSRIHSYFRQTGFDEKVKKLSRLTNTIEIIEVESEFEALLLESRLIKLNSPKFNVLWKDDKSYIYIQITKEEFPRILLSRKRLGSNLIFGPFPSSRIVREILGWLRRVFPYCVQKPPLKRVCFYSHLGLCRPCPGEIIKKPEGEQKILKGIYMNNINSIKKILSGNGVGLIKEMEIKMRSLSELDMYEEAALYRDRISNLKRILKSARFRPDEYIHNPQKTAENWQIEQKSLVDSIKPYLQLSEKTSKIECYDISNISGKFATGSMVTFEDGRPDKSKYRRFRIKFQNTPNDFEMLKEVFHRRFAHREWPFPDLIMVDGGALQLSVLLKALEYFNIKIAAISLAKKFEEIYVPQNRGFRIIRLEKSSPALNLVKRIRDEAHRFALSYHKKLRVKYLLDLLHK